MPARVELTSSLPGLSPVAGKSAVARFDGGRLLRCRRVGPAGDREAAGIADRLATCLEDPRTPGWVVHGLAEIIRFRLLMTAAGYEDGNDADGLRRVPALGRFVTAILRPAKRPKGTEIRAHLRRIVRQIRANWPRVEILLRADSHYCCPTRSGLAGQGHRRDVPPWRTFPVSPDDGLDGSAQIVMLGLVRRTALLDQWCKCLPLLVRQSTIPSSITPPSDIG